MTTGSDIVKLASKHLGETYILGAFAPKDNANWKGPWDCAEFASWVTFQATGILMGCTDDRANPAVADAYSGAWARDASASERQISIGQATVMAGALLVRKPPPKGIGHVAISRGDGTTVEAHSAAAGVSSHAIDGRRWDLALLLPLVEYPAADAPAIHRPPADVVLRLTSPPMHGKSVKALQRALKSTGLDPGVMDGVFGPHTEAAVRAFQLQLGLVADGEAGRLTLKKLGLS